MNDGGDCRTAPATPGLLKIEVGHFLLCKSFQEKSEQILFVFLKIYGKRYIPMPKKPQILKQLPDKTI